MHVNEDIPIDSLAATGSRFQRQIRTERVRQAAGNRARASTGGSAGGPARGHSKSLSTSSIASIGSVGSGVYGVQQDQRRRPPPLVMADPRARASLESYRSGADSTYSSYRPASPSEFSTPTSATFSTGQSSPRWSALASPSSTHSRSQSLYNTGTRTPGRRLSVPSGANPFQSPHLLPNRPMFGPGSMNSSNAGVFSNASSLVSSPTASSSGWSVRRESTSSAADDSWRRRTWHPDSRSFSGHPSQLSTVVSQSALRANPPPPIVEPSTGESNVRLPGIDVMLQHRPMTPPRGEPEPMRIDSEQQPPPQRSALQLASGEAEERRNLNLYDASLQRGLNRLDISPNTPPRDSAGAWASEANKAMEAQAEQVRLNPPTIRFEDHPPAYAPAPVLASRALHHQTMSAPSITTSREGKRHGWYNGPVTVHREAPPPPQQQQMQMQQDPRAAHVERMVHPNFDAFAGFPGREREGQQEAERGGEAMGRLEALVAVATGEGAAATAY